MSEPVMYREIHISRLGGTLPEKMGSFVVGIPSKAVEAYRQQHPTDATDAVFRSFVSAKEHQQMKDMLGLSSTDSHEEQYPFHGEPQSLGTCTWVKMGESFGSSSKPTI